MIDSDAIDYRYPTRWDGEARIRSVDLADGVSRRCFELTRRRGLEVAGIDLRLDRDGTWWCFEVNSSPRFSWFADQTGQLIAQALAARLLIEDRALPAGAPVTNQDRALAAAW